MHSCTFIQGSTQAWLDLSQVCDAVREFSAQQSRDGSDLADIFQPISESRSVDDVARKPRRAKFPTSRQTIGRSKSADDMYGMQQAACSMQQAPCGMQQAACNRQHATCDNMQHATRNMRQTIGWFKPAEQIALGVRLGTRAGPADAQASAPAPLHCGVHKRAPRLKLDELRVFRHSKVYRAHAVPHAVLLTPRVASKRRFPPAVPMLRRCDVQPVSVG